MTLGTMVRLRTGIDEKRRSDTMKTLLYLIALAWFVTFMAMYAGGLL
jgi:hypothetical protein